jgi:hypothetical protein
VKADGGASLGKDKEDVEQGGRERASKLVELWVRDGEGPEDFFLNGKSLIFA